MFVVVIVVIPRRTGQRVVGGLGGHGSQLGPQLGRLHRRRRRQVDRGGAHAADLATVVSHSVTHLDRFSIFNHIAKLLLSSDIPFETKISSSCYRIYSTLVVEELLTFVKL